MAEQLASVPEESTTDFTAPSPPCYSYRESIRRVAVAWHELRIIRPGLFPQSGHSGSNYSSNSGASSSYLSNISSCSPGSVSAAAADLGASELMKIAHKMVTDGYIQQIVQAFDDVSLTPASDCGSQADRALKTWLVELDVDWVLQMRGRRDMERQLQQQGSDVLWFRALVERWIRAFTVIVASIKELVATVHETPAVARFGKASISAMLLFANAIIQVDRTTKLQAALHMYICLSSASYDMCTTQLISSEAQSIFNDIGSSLDREGNMLFEDISDTMMELRRALMMDNYSWAFNTGRGAGAVHTDIRLLVDCVVSMRKAQGPTQNSAQSHKTGELHDLIQGTIDYLKDLLLQKSKLCSDPSLRYLSLLNNFYFVAQVSEPSISLDVELLSGNHHRLELISECEEYMDNYLEVSWGHVISCISSSNFPGPLGRWINTSSMTKFQSAFHKTYQAQKFWKVPDPQLRSLLRETISKRVISGYRDYLKVRPRLEKHISGGSNSPDILEEMLGQLFEG